VDAAPPSPTPQVCFLSELFGLLFMHFVLLCKQIKMSICWVCFLVWIRGYSEIYGCIVLVLVKNNLNKRQVKFSSMFIACWIFYHAFPFDAVLLRSICFASWKIIYTSKSLDCWIVYDNN
jgi:hypothetical protein